MKLIIAIVQDDDVSDLTDKLTENKFSITRLASTGGFLKSGNTTLLIGVEEKRVEKVYSVIEKICKVRKVTTTLSSMTLTGDTYVPYPMEIKVGGATVFTVDVERYEQV